jgi:hypothetical protein
MWVLTAERQLKIEELSEGLSIEEKHTAWDEENFPDPDLIIESCAGIVETDSNGHVRFVHATVREFFTRPSPFGPDEWASGFFIPSKDRHIRLAKSCLTYLDFDDFNCDCSTSADDLLQRFEKYKYLDYASKFWARHYRGTGEVEYKDGWKKYLAMSDAKLENWCETLFLNPAMLRGPQSPLPYLLSYDNTPEIPRESLETIVIAIFGLETLLEELQLKEDHIDPRTACRTSGVFTITSSS